MKKKLVLLMTVAVIASLTGCGLVSQNNRNTTNEEDDEEDDDDDDDDEFQALTVKDKDGTATFIVSVKETIASDSWLGICEESDYVYEEDADDYDLVYSYPEDYIDRDGNISFGPYTYSFDYSGLEDGDYTLVLTDTDAAGYVIFYMPCTIKNNKLKVKTDKIEYNVRPDDIDPVIVDYEILDGDDYGTIPADPDDGFTFPDDDGTSDDGFTDYVRDPLEFAEISNDRVSESDVVGTSVHNDTLVLKYTGSANVCGESSLYYILGGFYDNGDVNWLTGTSRLWYFFDDETSYNIAFAAAQANEDIIIKDYNPVSHYFSVITFFRNDWDTYDGIVANVSAGILPEQMPPTPDYVVVQ